MGTDIKLISRRIFEEGFNKGQFDVIDQFLSPSVVVHDPAMPPGLQGADGLRQMITMYRAAFPDLRLTVDDQIVESDRVVTRWSASGTHRGPLGDVPATGKRASITGMTIDKFANGKLVESWANWDSAGLMQQLGVVPRAQAPKAQANVGGDGARAQDRERAR